MRLKGRKVLVTGAAGFLGSHLCEKLLIEGSGVRGFDIFNSGKKANLSGVLKKIDLVCGDVSSEDVVARAAMDVDAIVHLAFPMELRRRSMDNRAVIAALAGLMNLIQAALRRKAVLVYISSIAVYGNGQYNPIDESHPLEPVLIHGAVKLAGENLCATLSRSHGLRVVILRVADIYGPRNTRVSVPIKFLLQALRDEPITVYGDGSDSRTYTFIDDFSEAVVMSLLCPGAIGEIFNIGGDECVTMHQLALEVKKVTGSGSPVWFKDAPAAGRRLVINNLKSKKILGLKHSVSLTRGLSETYKWLLDNPGYY
ncbi:UDP-glucose 4-epimerase [Desulfotomaculum arcticum]|uniref:UDP-glucose 4-epimerase n=1 Tax=Desulfotruncus arcticus DSM 17038 TaxID=1121424 RepID=A0A1I2VJT7_9FIRM|nr:NAD-dependent epimerase/dehydratase family protein [Desulfotruncus arcticus]SFG89373.1 UDP-glucose 4-epimerase [Desulfotomaculum arcticum] [Desulfotruncus arcticus DSM 17038]